MGRSSWSVVVFSGRSAEICGRVDADYVQLCFRRDLLRRGRVLMPLPRPLAPLLSSSLLKRWCVTNFCPHLRQHVQLRTQVAAAFPARLPVRPDIHRWVVCSVEWGGVRRSRLEGRSRSLTWHTPAAVHGLLEPSCTASSASRRERLLRSNKTYTRSSVPLGNEWDIVASRQQFTSE